MDHEQAALRLALRRRRGGVLGIAVVPAVLLVGYLAVTWDDGPPAPSSVLALVALAAAVSVGWWWLERGAGGSALGRAPRRRGEPTPAELDDARAEVALRTCSPPPPGGRARLETLVARRSRDARMWRWVGPGYLAIAVVTGVTVVQSDGEDVPWPVPLFWAALAVIGLVRARRDRRLTRRWLAAHGSPQVAGQP